MYCSKCGKELPEDAKFCSECGTSIYSRETAEPETKLASDTKPSSYMGPVITSLLGFLAIAYALITYVNDTSTLFGFNYKPPLTNHENMVILIGTLGAFVFIIGVSWAIIKAVSNTEE